MTKAAAADTPKADRDLGQVSLTILMARPLGQREGAIRSVLGKALGKCTLEGTLPGLPVSFSDQGATGTVIWGNHRVQFIEIMASLPESHVSEMIQYTRAEKSTLADLRQHQSHVLCSYLGDAKDPVERIQASFQLAAALEPLGLAGAIHVDAWQCFSASALQHLCDPKMTEAMRTGLAQQIFCNLIPFHSPEGTWWASKGNHVFSIPDIALWDDGRIGFEPAKNIFSSLFKYLAGGATIQPGHTMELGGMQMQAGEVTEFRKFLCGPGTTLAIRPVGSNPAKGGGILILPLLFGLLMLGLIFAVPPFHTQEMLILAAVGGFFILVGFAPLILARLRG